MNRLAPMIAISSALLAVALGCGGGDNAGPRRQSAADSSIAQRIEQSARKREQEQQSLTARTSSSSTAAGTPAQAGQASAAKAAAASRGGGALLSAADRVSFARLAARLPGAEGAAVSSAGIGRPVSSVGSLRTGVAWSTAKVPVAMATLTSEVGSRADRVAAITASDNAAAERLWASLGGGASAAQAATRQLRAAGDRRTEIQAQKLRVGYTAFGQTAWRLSDQARFVAGMSCTRAGRQVLSLMGDVAPGQRWGLGSTGQAAQLKGGWGPGISPGTADGWLDRQMGVLRIDGKAIAVAIATTASDHGTGTQNLTRLANWVTTHIDLSSVAHRPSCT